MTHPVLILPSDQDATGRTLGEEEIQALAQVVRSGILTSTKGPVTKRLEQRFAELLGVRFAFACSSGTAAIHTAVAALDPEPGDEIVTTAVTDMGALAPILYQGAIPVFADVDPHTFNVTAASIRRVLSPRTRAILVTHLFGNPCEMPAILELAHGRGLPVIEDCAQAFMARSGGKLVGSLGRIAAFSIQQGKHITSGEGGLVVTDDEALARRCFLFINKAWGYGDAKPDHYFLALNYRMNELTAAVALAQLEKLEGAVHMRCERASSLSKRLRGLAGVELPVTTPDSTHTYWKYCVRVDPRVIEGGGPGLAARLREYGIASAPRYIQKPAFQCEIFREQRTFGTSRWPFSVARPEALDYSPARYPGTFDALEHILVLPWNERYEEKHVAFIADSLREAAGRLAKSAR